MGTKIKRITMGISMFFLILILVCMSGYKIFDRKKQDDWFVNSDITTENATSEVNGQTDDIIVEDKTEELRKEATLVAVGDDLVHTGVYYSGRQEDGTYDYSGLFAGVKPYIQNADLRIINQETIFGGDDLGWSSFPYFNSPEGIGDAVAQAGFNVVLHATNHAMDMNLDGLFHTANFWKEKYPEITVLGITGEKGGLDTIPVAEVNGIRIAMLNYTYSHNMGSFNEAAEGYLNILCNYDSDSRLIDLNTIHPKVLNDIRQAESLADFTIVFPHWGTEYVLGTTEQQTSFAKQMVGAGADLIIGCHPHVIEPVEYVEADNGNRALCYYSLGNFTGNQDTLPGILGGMASLTIVQDEAGTYVEGSSIKAIPLVIHYDYPGWDGDAIVESTYLLRDYTEEQAACHGIRPRHGVEVTREKLLELSKEVFGEYFSLE